MLQLCAGRAILVLESRGQSSLQARPPVASRTWPARLISDRSWLLLLRMSCAREPLPRTRTVHGHARQHQCQSVINPRANCP